ncbi:MAG: filamentous hemagglutinin N-terminal domain-containing protein, partial [Nostoc sp.]
MNASESVEVIGTSATGNPSELSALTQSFGKSGTVTITTGQLIVRDGAAITVNSQLVDHFNSAQDGRSSGKAGDLNINARSILLDNQGQITSNSQSGKGGN